MGLVRDAEFGGNCHLVVFVFDLSVSLFLGVQGLHGLMFLILISHMFAFFKRLISAKPQCSRGGGGSLFFSACVGSRPASNFHPQKYHEFQAPKKYFTRAYVYMKISDPPPPPPPGSVLSAPVSQIKLA